MKKNSSKTLNDFNISTDQLIQTFKELTNDNPILCDLKHIFNIGLKDMSLFPNINLTAESTYKDYLKKWIKGYIDANNNPPSKRIASPKGSCSDPAIQKIVQAAQDISDDAAKNFTYVHNLFMSAENIQGNLLEEYISICIRPYDWIWCKGNVLRAVDFCTINGSSLLQIKNKSNTENSSSSAIRANTEIKKWYRLGTRTIQGEKMPAYKWNDLNSIINNGLTPDKTLCNMNEESYLAFLYSVVQQNRDIITYK